MAIAFILSSLESLKVMIQNACVARSKGENSGKARQNRVYRVISAGINITSPIYFCMTIIIMIIIK